MNKIKYIILDNDLYGPRPYIFSDQDQHNVVASKLKGATDEIVGAGFVTFTDKGVHCWGESVSLDIASRHELDSKIINRAFGLVPTKLFGVDD